MLDAGVLDAEIEKDSFPATGSSVVERPDDVELGAAGGVAAFDSPRTPIARWYTCGGEVLCSGVVLTGVPNPRTTSGIRDTVSNCSCKASGTRASPPLDDGRPGLSPPLAILCGGVAARPAPPPTAPHGTNRGR